MELNEKFSTLRRSAGFSQEQVAKLLGLERSMYGKIETGERFLSIYRAEQLASLYGLSFNEIYDEENPSPKIKMALRAKKDIKSGDIKFIAELNRLVLNSTWMESISNENRKISFPIEKVSDNVDKLELNT